ncbi:MAG: AI-2E family transporter [Thermoanaerobaculia bacterium]|nr:AI-2E family transporter [Thermoanaerobaculia bacterium]
MSMAEESSGPGRRAATAALITLAVLAVLFFMREAQTIVVPLLTAVLLAVVGEAAVGWLCRFRFPRVLAVLLVVTVVALALFGIGILVGSSVQQLTERAPAYQARLEPTLEALLGSDEDSARRRYVAGVIEQISPGATFSVAARLLSGVRDVFANAFLMILLMVFILLEAPLLRTKLETIGGAAQAWTSIAASVRSYLAIKSLVSLATGLLIALFLLVLDVDFAILWGLLAFMLNYIPNLGSILAALPVVLLALVQKGTGDALIIAAGYLLVNVVIGNFIEPRLMGRGMGLSTLVVVLSLILWGWLLGPVGMLLSVPLTTSIRIAMEGHESTRSVAVILGREVRR